MCSCFWSHCNTNFSTTIMSITQMGKKILAIWNDIVVEFTFHLTWLVQSHQVPWLSHVPLTFHKKNIEKNWFNYITIKCDFSLKDIQWNSTPITYVIWQSKTSYTHICFTKVYGIDCLLSNTMFIHLKGEIEFKMQTTFFYYSTQAKWIGFFLKSWPFFQLLFRLI